MITKEELREEYETETGKTHGNALFSTTDYACWLEKRIVKNCSIPDVSQQREMLKAYDHFCEQKHCWYMGTEDETKGEFIKAFNCG